jgi:hypothetical protein
LSVDCCVMRLLPLTSPSTTSASSCHDVAPSSADCRVAPLSVDLSNRHRRQHLSLLPGDRSEGRDMQRRSLDCPPSLSLLSSPLLPSLPLSPLSPSPTTPPFA